jgi:Group II intron, maturase-specific domain
VKAFLAKIRKHIKVSRNLTAGELIAELNPQIRGWALYHRHAVSKDVFHAVDHEIFKALWVWAQRRHRHKTRWWIKEKYWPSTGPNRWVFTGVLKDGEGQTKVMRLFSADSIPIERHTKIRAEANPYDPAWELYFEKRRCANGRHTQGKTMAPAPLERTREPLPSLSPEDHQNHGLAQSSCALAIQRRVKSGRKSGPTPSHLSSASS